MIISESEDMSHSAEEERSEKKIRKRKKRIYKSIRDQMEFYFSDSNLQKDKFLTNLLSVSEDGYIDLEVFLKFNKIHALTNDVKDISLALSQSDLLEVSEDGKQLRRTKAPEKKADVDDCTIYVERLPVNVDIDWLKAVFSNYGAVSYVSLPHFKRTGKPKGFAFVEFECPDSAIKACQHFAESSEMVEPSDIQHEEESDQDKMETNTDKTSKTELSLEKRKRKRESQVSDDENQKAAKIEVSEDQQKDVSNVNEVKEDEAEERDAKDENKEISGDEDMKIKSKKKRKHKKKPKYFEELDCLTLRVMSKKEWKSLKNKYLALQKSTMAQIKKMLFLECSQMPQQMEESAEDKKSEPIESKKSSTLEFQSGVILRVQMPEPLTSCSEFKTKMKALKGVVYVDCSEGLDLAHIRCADTESAATILKEEKSGSLGFMEILTGEEEKLYWEKIFQDKEKLCSQKIRQKKRGREKMIARREKISEQKNKHIRFD